MSYWIKCSERMPEDDSYVVAAKHYSNNIQPDFYAAWFYNGKFNVSTDALETENYDGGASIISCINVTHWMSIPAIID